jgi:hypothetical protein
MVLDSIAADWESIETMRNHGEVPPYGLALFDLRRVIDAVRSLVTDGLVEVREIDEAGVTLVPVAKPATDDANLTRYWFRPSDAGWAVWRDGCDVLDAYWEAHPPGGDT